METRRLDPRDLASNTSSLRRTALFQEMTEVLGDKLSGEELDIHFSHMPARYWARTSSATVQWHLELIHEFFAHLGATEHDSTPPIVRWKHFPDRGITEVQVCTWDRLGLLAKVAGAFTTVGLNIIRADIFTRADNIALDVFEICEPDGKHVRDEFRLMLMTQVLAASLKPDAPLLAGLEKIPAATSSPALAKSEVYFDGEHGDHYTLMMVETEDRVGLLYNIFTALSACDVNVAHAIITTDSGRVGDVFYLTDSEGREITAPDRLEHIRQQVAASIQ